MSTSVWPPGPTISRFDGLLLATRRRDPLSFLQSVAREYGDIAHFQVGSRRVFLLNHPAHIKEALTRYYESFAKGRHQGRKTRHFLGEGLLTSEGDYHRSQRKLIQPEFHKQQFTAHQTVILEHAIRMRDSWHDGQQLDIVREMKRLTLAITSKLIFNTKTDAEADEINDAVKLVLSQFSPFGSPLGRLTAKLPLSRARRVHRAQAALDRIIRRIITERRKSAESHHDFLSMLMETLDDPDMDPELNDLRVRDEALTFFLAGYETMGTAMVWTWYLLAQNQDAQEKLHAELDTVLGSRLPEMPDMAQLRYTKMVFAEAMRIYPPSWILARYLINDFAVGGYVMPAGSIVIISQYLMHHDSRFFPEPSQFRPDRWTTELKASRPQYSYLPFGGGPRGCLGEGLSWAEGVLLIATLAQRWRMYPVASQPVEMEPRVTLQPRGEVMLRLERRD